jgi:hypothetical protein
MKDLLILAADNDLKQALTGLLGRPEALRIRTVEVDIFIHPEHDPACVRRGVEFMSNFSDQYRHGLLMFDHAGSGRESALPERVQAELNDMFSRSVWGERARAIVLAPELEAWVWSDSPHVDDVIGWRGRSPRLRTWLVEHGWLGENEAKPAKPKEAFEAALRVARVPRSASVYRRIAERVSVRRCQDRAFHQFKEAVRNWFPQDSV